MLAEMRIGEKGIAAVWFEWHIKFFEHLRVARRVFVQNLPFKAAPIDAPRTRAVSHAASARTSRDWRAVAMAHHVANQSAVIRVFSSSLSRRRRALLATIVAFYPISRRPAARSTWLRTPKCSPTSGVSRALLVRRIISARNPCRRCIIG